MVDNAKHITLSIEQWRTKMSLVYQIGFDDGFDAVQDQARKTKLKLRTQGRDDFLAEFDALNK